MQSSRLISKSTMNNNGLLRTIEQQRQFLCQRVLSFANTTGRTADPADHSIEPEEVQPSDAIRDTKERHRSSANYEPTTTDNEPYVPPDPSIIRSAPKVESNAVGPRTDPLSQQKRRRQFSTGIGSLKIIRDASCAGIDGSPWPEEEEGDREPTRREQREQQERDDREYFEHHKASPLSEIEISDTRKPITKATDGDAPSSSFGYGGAEVVMFGPEQMDTAEDSLLRAAEMFRRNAVRGDPDSPHGRVLRQLRGEYW